ncbi:LOW QUALITY PROTEIN: kelch domain-containing protein 4 [Pogonomyrmex barbatus]|uniref:LOW QUALITY PROTEIN: kelch domain-containing protein 4 n=1 Tax=Pogonomyrmex barbatus TaxID=144034 RepID=A0A6I9WW83_9HYME|nr:LOW QUALITY PROTEIN: kelch domain-containing protein 4 [Pogonomyrmex barbatus]
MGKKDKKKKNKISGQEKTALKTEKKLNAKQKKELAALGEDDIEKVVAEIEREEARRQCVKEVVVDAPLRRVNFTLTAHPFKDELIMFGGEFHDGRQTIIYGDMFIYNINKREWILVKAPGAPPPRCGHQTVATMANRGGELWIFGGEFTSPSESQFYHYRDLWVFRFADKKWEKITAPNGPSARSGHRMIHIKKQLIVFGGFHDNLRCDYKYFNDVHIFCLETYTWRKIQPAGIAPAPRSGCMLLPNTDNKIVVYGGYSKEKIKKDLDRGCIHDDMFLLTQDKNDSTKYKWVCVKQTGNRMSPRCGASAVLIQPTANQAFVFGGVYDTNNDDEEEDLHGTFYNDLFALDLEKFHWRIITLTGKKETTSDDIEGPRKRRRKQKEENNDQEQSNDEDEEVIENLSNSIQSTVTVDDDGIFTVTVGPAGSSTILSPLQSISTATCDKETKFVPLPRINAGLAVKNNILYMYGGVMEENDRQYTFSDFYSLDCRKLDEWKILIANDLSSQTWFDSSESSDEDESEDDSEQEENNKLININEE